MRSAAAVFQKGPHFVVRAGKSENEVGTVALKYEAQIQPGAAFVETEGKAAKSETGVLVREAEAGGGAPGRGEDFGQLGIGTALEAAEKALVLAQIHGRREAMSVMFEISPRRRARAMSAWSRRAAAFTSAGVRPYSSRA